VTLHDGGPGGLCRQEDSIPLHQCEEGQGRLGRDAQADQRATRRAGDRGGWKGHHRLRWHL